MKQTIQKRTNYQCGGTNEVTDEPIITSYSEVVITLSLSDMRCIAADLNDLDPARIGKQTKQFQELLRNVR